MHHLPKHHLLLLGAIFQPDANSWAVPASNVLGVMTFLPHHLVASKHGLEDFAEMETVRLRRGDEPVHDERHGLNQRAKKVCQRVGSEDADFRVVGHGGAHPLVHLMVSNDRSVGHGVLDEEAQVVPRKDVVHVPAQHDVELLHLCCHARLHLEAETLQHVLGVFQVTLRIFLLDQLSVDGPQVVLHRLQHLPVQLRGVSLEAPDCGQLHSRERAHRLLTPDPKVVAELGDVHRARVVVVDGVVQIHDGSVRNVWVQSQNPLLEHFRGQHPSL
mmetsp:Transcript_24595/g.46624  ORF Transcript_24595/g.46624 Transcript_24595/m.46624 type:complete len:273 (+) Transcript_24595:798-1616(+)